MPSQASLMMTAAGTGRLEQARGGRGAKAGHAVAVDVQHGQRGRR